MTGDPRSLRRAWPSRYAKQSWSKQDPVIKGNPSPQDYESVTKRGARSWKNAMFGNSGHRFLLFPSDLDWSAQLASQGMLQLDCAENIQHAFQVVDHTSQTDLRLRASHPAEQETRVSEYAVLQRGERMFDGGSS